MGGGNQQDDGWTAVGRMSRNIDPSRMKITKVSKYMKYIVSRSIVVKDFSTIRNGLFVICFNFVS